MECLTEFAPNQFCFDLQKSYRCFFIFYKGNDGLHFDLYKQKPNAKTAESLVYPGVSRFFEMNGKCLCYTELQKWRAFL
ncbi:hypothetical protein BO224_12795 [Erysipelotrichaceae bacterium NYU-BL-E8]|uniref:Uncharacterized protein n=1 Tax=Ileibacterium valens TaxID=1862668 RepID=A0A1U7NHC1_9FIRM|nr:hypothetical protein BO224_12795 [Erysipelotrichaceae bacterium NYU-BL-E8]OLU37181.1 hypothetical protein BM735_11145 [Erysipelotrichaceae bacterium NYU-BL-F16]OLU41045.1 hypothetical protein BO222_03965 [Ileibacterium valens]